MTQVIPNECQGHKNTNVMEWKIEKMGEVSAMIYVDICLYIHYSISVLAGNIYILQYVAIFYL